MIIVDDASTDQSKMIAQSYDNPRIKVIELPTNVGRTIALNEGLKFCAGKYIAILDADDVARPERLMRQVEFLDSNLDYGVIGSWATFIDKEGQQIGSYRPVLDSDELYQYLGWCDPLIHSSLMWRAEKLHGLGGYNGPPGLEDHATLIDTALHSRIGIISQDLVFYRHVTDSLSHSSALRPIRLRSELTMLYKVRQSLKLNHVAIRRNRRSRSLLFIRLGLTKIRTRSFIGGLLQVTRGILLDPMIVFYPFRTKEWDNRWHPQRRFSQK
jgi:glycosyltransferase involved in cell wall biosynthesis